MGVREGCSRKGNLGEQSPRAHAWMVFKPETLGTGWFIKVIKRWHRGSEGARLKWWNSLPITWDMGLDFLTGLLTSFWCSFRKEGSGLSASMWSEAFGVRLAATRLSINYSKEWGFCFLRDHAHDGVEQALWPHSGLHSHVMSCKSTVWCKKGQQVLVKQSGGRSGGKR